ncbi:hypothetical protein [Streptomyces sp. E2N166]|uniref:hypothetical protein n=1 Tax=Streptomyces sp. E2N166 TaxID=1851909 RepID=UPI0031F6B34F
MTAEDIGARETAAAVLVRTDGEVDEESLAYLHEKVAAALDRPGLPPVNGEVRVRRASAHHVEPPWSGRTDIRVGSDLVVVHAREASARELAAGSTTGCAPPPNASPTEATPPAGRPPRPRGAAARRSRCHTAPARPGGEPEPNRAPSLPRPCS